MNATLVLLFVCLLLLLIKSKKILAGGLQEMFHCRMTCIFNFFFLDFVTCHNGGSNLAGKKLVILMMPTLYCVCVWCVRASL